MHGSRAKRGRSENVNQYVLQAWVRMTLKALMIIGRALSHRVHHHLKIPGPRGVLARQMIEMGDLLENSQLERVVTELSQVLHDRSLQGAVSRSSTPTEWSKVTSTTSPFRKMESTQTRGTYYTQEYASELPSVSTGHTRSANGQHVGHSVQPRLESGQSAMSLREGGHALDLEDRAQSRSTFLEVRSGEESAVQFLPMADVSASPTRPPGEFQHGVLHPTSARHVPPQAHHQGGLQRPQFESEVQGLREASLRREDTSGSHVAAEEESRGSHDTNVAILHGDSAQDGARQQGFSRVPDVAPCTGGEAEQLDSKTFEPHGTLHVSEGHQTELRPGLRRHIFGCLKRAELSWLEIHRLLCETSDDHIDQTCKFIRESLQLQQPHLRYMADLYLLQPKQLKTVAEVCNPGRFSSQTDHFGLRSGQAFDLELGWNLLDSKQQQSVLEYIRTERPGLTIMSPPCVKFSMLLNLSWPKWCGNPKKFDQHIKELRDAKKLLKFCAKVCELCRSLGLSFLFEHPWSASSWQEPCLQSTVEF